MPKRVIDFDALWASDKIASCPAWAQAEYAWLYGLADASGSFEITNLRVIWGRVAAVRKDLTIERLEQIFQEFIARGLLFTWEAAGKRYGHWTGSDVPGRLPPPSWRARLERLAPPLPRRELAAYTSRFASRRMREFDDESAAPSSAKREQEQEQGKQYMEREKWREGAEAVAREDSAPEESESTEAQLKLGLEPPQAQEWDRDWKEEERREVTPGGMSASLPPESPRVDPSRPTEACGAKNAFPDELLANYERERGNLPAALALTPERRRQCALRARAGLRSEEFAAAVRRAAATPFLAGEGARGWRANFDWFIANDTNVRKVLEGIYEPSASRATAHAGYAPRAMDRTLYSELHVGSGPVCADSGARVRPEVVERVRAREAGGRPP